MSKKKKTAKKTVLSNLQTGITIFIFIVIIIIAAFVTSLYFYTQGARNGVRFPDTPLTKVINETHSYIGDSALDQQIQCPTIPVIMSVGGTERGYTEEGCVFRYDDRLSISVYELTDSAYNVLGGSFTNDLYNGKLSGSACYVADTNMMDVGYFNGYPAEYQCGIINITDNDNSVLNTIYTMTLVLKLGFDKDAMITVSTDKKAALYDAGVLLESIGYTVMDISQTAYGDTLPSTNENSTEEETSFEESSLSDETTTPTQKISQTMNMEVTLLEDYEDGAYIIFKYTSLDADVSGLQLTSVDNSSLSVKGTDTGTKGILAFLIPKGQAIKGKYYIEIPNGMDLGTFATTVLNTEEYTGQYNNNVNEDTTE